MTAVGEGELLTPCTCHRRASGDGFAGLAIGTHGTYIVNAAATVSRMARGWRSAASTHARPGDGDGGALAGAEFSKDAVRKAAEGLGTTLDPPSDVHGRGSTAATSPRSPRPARSCRRPRGGRGSARARHEQPVSLEVNGEEIELEVPPPAPRPLPPGRPRAHRHPYRLRHRQLRRLHRPRERRAGEELHDAGRPGRGREDLDGRGARARRRADRPAARVQRPPCAPVRLLHARDAHERDRAARARTRARRRRTCGTRCRGTSAAAPGT